MQVHFGVMNNMKEIHFFQLWLIFYSSHFSPFLNFNQYMS